MKLTNTSGQSGESWYPSFRGIKLDVGFGRDTTLTVVSVMQVDGGFLMCADTQVTEEKLRTRGTKIFEHPTYPLVWGYTGEMSLGSQFGRWFQGYNPPTLTWDQLQYDASDEITKVTKRQRDLIRQGDGRPTRNDNVDALVAGYIDGIPNILVLYGTGEHRYLGDERFFAIGSGGVVARIAFYTVRHWSLVIKKEEFQLDPELERFVTAIGAEYDQHSSPPMKHLSLFLDDIGDHGKRRGDTVNQEGI